MSLFVLETKIEVEVCVLAYDYLGIENIKLKVPGKTALPDRMYLVPGGKPLLHEYKRPGEEPEPKQIECHNHLRELGYEVQVHDDSAIAFQAIIDFVEPLCVHAQSRKVLARARRRCAVLRSRPA